ncbi:VTT domain-containing protein [Candidatus Kaiserbacteria bacterium]|nr:VTT domain-containing protein [Candidatus Kaiserbacteria bacterium]
METIIALLGTYRIPAIFIGSFAFGDSVIITGAYLAGQLHWSVAPIFLAALCGVIASDCAWFLLGRMLARQGSRIAFFEKGRDKIVRMLERFTGDKPHWWLVYIKFLYGGRIAMILYVAAQGMRFATFFAYNTLGILIWFVLFFPLGYVAGRGVSRAMPLINVLEMALIVLVVSFIVVRLFNIWLTREIEK